MRPYRHPSPLPLLDHFRVGLFYESSDPSEYLASPITQFLDSRIYQLRRRRSPLSSLHAILHLLHHRFMSFPLPVFLMDNIGTDRTAIDGSLTANKSKIEA